MVLVSPLCGCGVRILAVPGGMGGAMFCTWVRFEMGIRDWDWMAGSLWDLQSQRLEFGSLPDFGVFGAKNRLGWYCRECDARNIDSWI